MGLQVETGSRLIASTIDSIAEQSPHKSWASIPIDNEDLSKGFRDISYKDFANAINHASWWLKDQFHGETAPFETIAYAGPGDLLYPILAVAAVKCGKKVWSLSLCSSAKSRVVDFDSDITPFTG